MNLLISICARGGSKGIPGKNVKHLNDIPLIAYTIRTAQVFAEKHNADIGLSTDSNEILEVASKYGVNTKYKRPAELATDSAGKIDVISDLIRFQEGAMNKIYDFILDLDITSPLRTQEDLQNALDELIVNREAQNIFSVNPAARNPYFNMVEESKGGYVQLVKDCANIKSRQAAPKVYDMNASFYFYRRRFFTQAYETVITDKSMAFVMNHICFDLDEPQDFLIMEYLLKRNKLDFEL